MVKLHTGKSVFPLAYNDLCAQPRGIGQSQQGEKHPQHQPLPCIAPFLLAAPTPAELNNLSWYTQL